MPSFKAFFASILVTQGVLVLAAPPPVIFSCTKPKTAAITFDDGPWEYTKVISDTLVAAGAKGTFFLNGDNWSCIYDKDMVSNIQYAYAHGHQISSHTWTHADLTTLTQAQINTELDKVDTALGKILGIKPKFVRPPYGSYNNLARQVAADRNVTLVNWDVDSEDSVGATVDESKAIYDEFIGEHPPTVLALNHEPYDTTAYEVLPYLIGLLQKNNYTMVTVAECLGQPPYLSVGNPSPRDSTWKC